MTEKSLETIFLVPARGGSKGLPGKNLRLLSGQPLIQWTLTSIQNCSLRFEAFVSSDSTEILGLAEKFGVTTLLRSKEASCDESLAKDVVLDFLDKIPDRTRKNLAIIYLQPTSPLREGHHIEEAYSLFLESGMNPVVSVVEPMLIREKYLQTDHQKKLQPASGESPTINRQSGGNYLYPNGAIYIFTVADFLETGDIPVEGSLGYKMDKRSSLDIDDSIDLLIAEGRKIATSYFRGL